MTQGKYKVSDFFEGYAKGRAGLVNPEIWIEEYLIPKIPKNIKTIVDFGCANGRNLLPFKDKYNCIGFDIFPKKNVIPANYKPNSLDIRKNYHEELLDPFGKKVNLDPYFFFTYYECTMEDFLEHHNQYNINWEECLFFCQGTLCYLQSKEQNKFIDLLKSLGCKNFVISEYNSCLSIRNGNMNDRSKDKGLGYIDLNKTNSKLFSAPLGTKINFRDLNSDLYCHIHLENKKQYNNIQIYRTGLSNKVPKAIVLGGGSIGKRHSKILNDIGITTRIVDIEEIDNIDNILEEENFDLGLVCTPTSYHIDHCLKLAEYNIHIFCEKAFYNSYNEEKIKKLIEIVEVKDLANMVACNLRFTSEVKQLCNTPTPLVDVFCGYNLKKWRPDTNHLESYSANKKLGGGVLLDSIHELDYLYFAFGQIQSMTADIIKATRITNDTEDVVKGKIHFKNGVIAYFTLDYLSEEYLRYYDVVDQEVDSKKRTHFNFNDQNTNQMYVDQMKYFVDCCFKYQEGFAGHKIYKANSKWELCMNNFKKANYLTKLVLDQIPN